MPISFFSTFQIRRLTSLSFYLNAPQIALKTASKIASLVALLSVTVTVPAMAQQDPSADKNADKTETVTIKTTRDPVDKSYAKIVKGMDLFDKFHHLAPTANLRYKLLRRLQDTDMTGIKLRVVGDTITIPVAIDENNTFSLERNAVAYKEDASVMTNRKAHSMTWRTDIRTPGLPANTRRLGDLRLECRVGFESGLISEGIPIISTVVGGLVSTFSDPCEAERGRYLLFADQAIFSVSMVFGERREVLPISWLYQGLSEIARSKYELSFFDSQSLIDRTYLLPLGDQSWPDDTLIEFEFMNDPVSNHQP